jgi:hypothetical protein
LLIFVPKKSRCSVQLKFSVPKTPLTATAFNCFWIFKTKFVKHKNVI